MKNILACLLAIFIFVAPAYSYPQDEFDDCVSSSKNNTELTDVTDESIKGFCDCALTKIFDENKIDNLWMNVCLRENFDY